MILVANNDIYGNMEQFTSEKMRHILDLLDEYMSDKPYTIQEIRQDDVNDPHGRIDIEVRFEENNGNLIQQKLLILNGELVDGETFHKRFHEWY